MNFQFVTAVSRRFGRNYLRETSGNVAVIAGLAILPILGIVGLAIDFQLVITKKNTVQQTLDATMIAAARERQGGRKSDDVNTFAGDFFESMLALNDPNLQCGRVVTSIVQGSEQINGVVDCVQPTTLSAIFGRERFDFQVGSGSTFGVEDIDVAFVFDLSGSMNDNGRLDALKEAANSALDTLLPESAEDVGTVRVGIATYNHSVNAGRYFAAVTDRNTRSMGIEASEDVGDNYDDYLGVRQIDASNGRTFFDFETVERGSGNQFLDFAARFYYDTTCVYQNLDGDFNADDPATAPVLVGHPIWDYGINNGDETSRISRDRKERGQNALLSMRGQYRSQYDPSRDQRRNANSGVLNTPGNSSVDDVPEISQSSALTFHARFGNNVNGGFPLTGCRPNNEPVPLTTDDDDLRDFIEDMEAGGGTAGHLGIAWGWNILSPDWKNVWPRVSEPLEYFEEDSAKALVIMTDGAFNSTHPMAADTSTELAAGYCDAIKANTNITIFTVGFEVPDNVPTVRGSGGKTILEYCASSSDFIFDADGSQELKDAFVQIAAEISDLRIAR